jgi:hypothetical protein
VILLVQSFQEMLRAGGAGSQELHHRAVSDFSHKYQSVVGGFYLMKRPEALNPKAV